MNTDSDPARKRPSSATPAGTVMVVRDADEPRVLMVRRQRALRILGGFWVFPGGAVDAAETSAALGDRAAREAAGAAASRELREEAGLSVAPGDLLHWAHWITPAAVQRRFDTHFFVTASPRGQEPCLSVAEASELRWVTQREWESAESGGFPLTPPTLLVLRELTDALARHASLEALLAHERGRIVRPVLPKLLGDAIVVLPWDPDYGDVPGEGIEWDAPGIAERAGWPRRLPAKIGGAP